MQARRSYHSYQHNHAEQQQQHAVAYPAEPDIATAPYPLVSPSMRWQQGVAVVRGDTAYLHRERQPIMGGMIARSEADREERHRDKKGFLGSAAMSEKRETVGAAKGTTIIFSPPVPRSRSIEGFASNRADERPTTAAAGIMSPVPPPLIPPAITATSTVLLSISSPRRLRIIDNSYDEEEEEEEGSPKNTKNATSQTAAGDGRSSIGNVRTAGASYSYFDYNSFVTSPPPARRSKREEIGGAYGGGTFSKLLNSNSTTSSSGHAQALIAPTLTTVGSSSACGDVEEEEDGVVAALRSHYASPTVLATFKGLRRGGRSEDVSPKMDKKEKGTDTDSEESESTIDRVTRSLHADKNGNDTDEERISEGRSGKEKGRKSFFGRDRPTTPSARAATSRRRSAQSVGDRLWSLHQAQMAKREAQALQRRLQEEEEILQSHTFCPATNNRENHFHHYQSEELAQHEGQNNNNNVFRRLSTPTTTPNRRTKGEGRVSHHTTHSPLNPNDGEEKEEGDGKLSSQQTQKGSKKLSKAEADALFNTQMEWEARRREKMRALQETINEQKAGERPGTPTINAKSRELAESRFTTTAAAVAGDVKSTSDDKGRGSSSSSIRKLKVEDRLALGETARQDRLRELAAKVAAEERGRPRSHSSAHHRSGRNADDASNKDKNGVSPEKERGHHTSPDKAFERLYIDAAERWRRELEMERAAVFGEWAEAALAVTFSRDSSKRSSSFNPPNSVSSLPRPPTAADAPFAPQINARSAALVEVGPTMAFVRGEKSEQQLEEERLAREERRQMRMRAAEATRSSSSVSRPSEQNGSSHAATPRRSSTPPSSRPAASTTINPVSEAIATNRLVRCGMAHMPVHERLSSRVVTEVGSTITSNNNVPLALKQKLKSTTKIPVFTFTPQINSRSRALDGARNGAYAAVNNSEEEFNSSAGEEDGVSPRSRSARGQRRPQQTLDRVELLHRSYEASQRRLEAAREQRAAEEEEKLRRIRESALMYSKRLSGSALSSDNIEEEPYGARRQSNNNGQQRTSFEERAAAWEMRRAARVEHQRRAREETELAGCTFAPRTTKAPLFVHGSH